MVGILKLKVVFRVSKNGDILLIWNHSAETKDHDGAVLTMRQGEEGSHV